MCMPGTLGSLLVYCISFLRSLIWSVQIVISSGQGLSLPNVLLHWDPDSDKGPLGATGIQTNNNSEKLARERIFTRILAGIQSNTNQEPDFSIALMDGIV